jgi:hypothetical protein
VRRAQAEALKHGRRIAANQVGWMVIIWDITRFSWIFRELMRISAFFPAFGSIFQHQTGGFEMVSPPEMDEGNGKFTGPR